MEDSELKDYIARIKSGLRITKVVATRSVKTGRGDHFAGFSAAWNTVQDDGMHGLENVTSESAESASGMTLTEARVAFLLVALQADIGAYEASMANGNITPQACSDSIRSVRANYGKLIRMALSDESAKPDVPKAE